MPAVALAALLSAELSIHFGMGAGAIHTPGQDFHFQGGPWPSKPDGLAISLELQVEYGYVFGASTLVFASMNNSSEPVAASVRAGLFLLPTTAAPYVAVGVGWLNQLLQDGDSPPNLLAADGAALLAEVGVTGPRHWTDGRANVYAQIQKPLFDAPPDPYHTPPVTKPVYLAGIRLFF